MATKVWGKGDYKLKIEKRIIKVRSWKESLEKLIKARDNEKDFVSEALSSGRGSGRQPSQHSGLRVYLNLKVESAETYIAQVFYNSSQKLELCLSVQQTQLMW